MTRTSEPSSLCEPQNQPNSEACAKLSRNNIGLLFGVELRFPKVCVTASETGAPERALKFEKGV
jgi:hypothetical protein